MRRKYGRGGRAQEYWTTSQGMSVVIWFSKTEQIRNEREEITTSKISVLIREKKERTLLL